MNDDAVVNALAEAMQDPKRFRDLLSAAAQKTSGDVIGFCVTRETTPVTASSAGFLGHPADEHTVAWVHDTTMKFVTRVPVR